MNYFVDKRDTGSFTGAFMSTDSAAFRDSLQVEIRAGTGMQQSVSSISAETM